MKNWVHCSHDQWNSRHFFQKWSLAFFGSKFVDRVWSVFNARWSDLPVFSLRLLLYSFPQVTMNYFWFNRTLPQAVVDPRLHHQLLPMYIRIDKDYPMPLDIQEGLQNLGHEVKNRSGYAVVQAVARNEDGTLTGKSDPRKSGWAAGYWWSSEPSHVAVYILLNA